MRRMIGGAAFAAGLAVAAGILPVRAQEVYNVGYDGGAVWTPLALSIVPVAEAPDAAWDVYGLRLNIFVGRHRDVGGLDVGSLANLATGEADGISAAGLYNQVGSSRGLVQVAGVANRCEDVFVGLQTAPINLAGTVGGGLQVGVFNTTEALTGLQVGVVNYAYQAQGMQIGLLNIIADAPLPIMPVLNIGF